MSLVESEIFNFFPKKNSGENIEQDNTFFLRNRISPALLGWLFYLLCEEQHTRQINDPYLIEPDYCFIVCF